MDSNQTEERRQGFQPLILLLLGVAVLFRLSDISARNLWTDEAWVALAALAPTPGEALVLGRSTPPFYTLALWGLNQAFGGGEAVLRSLSFAFGVGTVVFFWLLARRLVSSGAVRWGLGLVCCSPVLVYFSKELKQYSGDAFFAVWLIYLAERLRASPSRAGWLALALSGPLALGFSHGAVFVLPVILISLWLGAAQEVRPRLVGLGALWGAAAAGFYFFFYRHQVDPELLAYWAQDFPDFSGLLPFLGWLAGALGRYGHYFFGDWGMIWGIPLTAVGLVILWRGGPRRLILYLAGPLCLVFLAAALHRYPFMGQFNGSRLLLFSAPFLYLTAAVGISAVLTLLWRSHRRWLALAAAALLLASVKPVALIQENLHPQANRQELKPLVAHLKAQLLPDDLVYVYYHAIYPFQYYYRHPPKRVCWGKSCVEKALALPGEGPEAPRRLWLVAAHFQKAEEMARFAQGLLGAGWRQEAALTRQKAGLFLYVRQDQSLARSPGTPPTPPPGGSAALPAGRACGETPTLPLP